MDNRHKSKAILGVALWVAVIPLMFAAIGICAKIDEKVGGVPKDMFGFIFVSFLIVQYFLFFGEAVIWPKPRVIPARF
jgi:hypothetical protein